MCEDVSALVTSENIFMVWPERFEDGLKQAPRVWNDTFNEFVIKYGLKQSDHDPCLYIGNDLILVLCVDDDLIAAE